MHDTVSERLFDGVICLGIFGMKIALALAFY